MLVGIGLMLVGAIAYALPQEQEFAALLPAFAGIVVATGGVVAMTRELARKTMMQINAFAAALLLVYTAIRIVPDSFEKTRSSVHLIADLDVLGLSAVFLYFAIKNWLDTKKNNDKKSFA